MAMLNIYSSKKKGASIYAQVDPKRCDKKFWDFYKKGEIVKIYVTGTKEKRYSTKTKGTHALGAIGASNMKGR